MGPNKVMKRSIVYCVATLLCLAVVALCFPGGAWADSAKGISSASQSEIQGIAENLSDGVYYGSGELPKHHHRLPLLWQAARSPMCVSFRMPTMPPMWNGRKSLFPVSFPSKLPMWIPFRRYLFFEGYHCRSERRHERFRHGCHNEQCLVRGAYGVVGSCLVDGCSCACQALPFC